MAYEQVVGALQWAGTCGATTLVGKLHYIMALSATDELVVIAAAASDKIIGVLREEAAPGAPVTVQFGGIAKVIAGGTVLPGDLITSDGSGKGIATTSAGNRIIGIAMANADSGDIFPVMLGPTAV